MNIANEAIANSIQSEMVLYAYRKNKDGVVVSFVVHPNDMPAELATAPIGSRFVAVLVQIGDDELPVKQTRKAVVQNPKRTPHRVDARPEPHNPPARAKRDWRDMPYPQQAAIRVGEATFAAYLREEHPDEWHETGDADACMKLICRIESKRELGIEGKRATLWFQLDSAYQAWKAVEHA